MLNMALIQMAICGSYWSVNCAAPHEPSNKNTNLLWSGQIICSNCVDIWKHKYQDVRGYEVHRDMTHTQMDVVYFAFCVLRSALFLTRPHDSSNLQIWTPVAI